MLRLTFLGTKGEVEVKSRKHQRHSCLLVEYKDTRLLIDFGADWKGRLTEVNPTHIALTHAHPDHAWGLTEETEIPVYARSVTFDTLKPNIRDNLKEKVRMRNFEPYKAGDLTVRAIPVTHSVNFPANGFIIEAGGRTIGYFPDVLHITNYKRILHGLDIYIGDGAYLEDKPGRVRRTPDGRPYGHALIRDQVRWASQAGIPVVIFTHFGEQAIKEPERLEKAFDELSKEFNVQIIEAFDGMSYSLKSKAVYPGLYLVPPHARLIAEGKKTLIVSTKLPPEHYVNRPLLLIEDKKAYGFITITNVTGPHDADEVREKLRDKHQITDEEWNAWWKGKQQVFLYEFKFKPFDEPVPVSVPHGAQKFVRSVRIRLSATENVLKLYEKLKDELPRFEDEVWLRDETWFGKKTVPTMEHKLLMALSWLHRTAEQQLAIYHQVREAYDKLGKRLHEMQPADVDKLPYPVDPPKRWLKNLVRFLKDSEMTFDDLCTKLKKLYPLEAKRVLQDIFGTAASKLIEVFRRAYLPMDACPIDFHVADVLKKHTIPPDSDLIVSICHMYGIPVRPFARAVYSIGEVALVKPSTVKEVLKNPELLHKWTDAQLFDDHRICHMWAGKHWKTLPKDLTPEDVKRFHDLLLTEIQRRGLTFEHKTPLQLATEVGKVGELAELINVIPKGDHQSVTLTAQTSEEISVEAHKPSPYAEIHRYGQDLGRTVDIAEVLQCYSKPIILQKGYVKLVGSLANYGETKGDIDIRIDEPDLLKAWPVVFRIGRALPPDLAWRVQFHDNRYPAFTSHVDLYDLALIVPEDRRLIRMATKGRIETIKDPVAKRQAWEALRTDTVKPLQYVLVLKGYRAHYKHIDQLTVEETESWFGKEAYPIAVQMKYDGAVVVLMKDGDKVIIRTDAGFDVTKRLPTIVELARKILPKTITLVAETEMWIGNKHQPREVTAGYLNAKTPPDDSNIVLNVFDVVYFHDPKYEHHELPGTVGDLHKKPYELRLRYLQLIDWPQSTTKVRKPGFNLAPTRIAHNPEELLKLLRWAAEGAASEGAVVKSLHMKYELDGLSELQLKWKKVGEIHAIVWKQEETKTPGVYTLYIAVRIPAGWKVPKKRIVEVDEKQYMAIGKTFNVAGGAKPGTIVSVTFHSLNWYINDRTGEQYIHIYEPKFAGKRPDQKVPDSAEDAVNIARNLELLTVKRLQWKSFMDDKPHKAVMQIHYRGQSAHMDFRIADAKDQYLLGYTVMVQKAGKIKEDVTSVEQAKRIEKNWDYYFKMSNDPQTYLVSPTRKLWVEYKGVEPKEWLNVEGAVKPGEVGATRYEWGVFSIVDKPTVYFGCVKPDYHELFIYGKKFTGRWVIRLLPNPWRTEQPRFAFVKLMWKPEDQMPYVLSERSVEKQWMPPYGISALPPEIRKQIPKEYQYWKVKDRRKAREIRDKLVEAIENGEVKIEIPKEWVRG